MTLRIASYNVHKCVGTDGKRLPGRIVDAINAVGADVMALQEVDRRLGPRPAALPRELILTGTDFTPLPRPDDGPSLGWHGQTILVRSGIEIAHVEGFDLPGLEPRGAVIADLDTPAPLRVVAVHLGLLRAARRRQLDAIKAALGRHAARPTVILGDFNERSRRVGLGRIATPFMILPTAPTFPSRRPFLPLDRIVHSPDLELHPLPPDRAEGHQPSDHLPVLADLRWL